MKTDPRTLFHRTIIGITIFILLPFVYSCGDKPTTPQEFTDWTSATPESQGLNPYILDTLTTRLQAGELGKVSSLLIVRGGKLVYEEYFRGFGADDLHVVHSVTKSIAATLVGMAVDEGKITSVQTKLFDYFPSYTNLANPSADKDSITLAHVLQMRAGFEWDEQSTPYGTAENPVTRLYQSADMFKFVLDLPMADPPGTKFVYNTGSSMLLSGVIAHAVGRDVESYAKDKLFTPLNITEYTWITGPNNVHPTGDGLSLRPRDMAKIGYLYLQDGVWSGRRLLSGAWIAASTQPYTQFTDGTGYGYQWWLLSMEFGPLTIFSPFAAGWGDQYIIIVPILNMVVVSTAEHFADEQSFIDEIVFDYILESAMGN